MRKWMGLLPMLLAAAFLCMFLPLQTQAQEEWKPCFGQLHSHSGEQDVPGPAQDVFASAKEAGMDFFALTDFSHSFENGVDGALGADGMAVSSTWAAAKLAAAEISSEAFAAIAGFEMSWPADLNLGHVITFATPGWQCRDQEGYETLERYYQALTTVPGSVGMFCHPGDALGNFEGFTHHSAGYNRHMTLLEVWGEDGRDFLNGYQQALDAGWHVAPTASGASHKGNWGSISPVRTVILASELTEQSLYDAMRSRRVYATQDPDLSLSYRLDGEIMGSTLLGIGSGLAEIHISDPTDGAAALVEVVTQGGQVVASQQAAASDGAVSLNLPAGHPYYYLRITQTDGDMAVTAPVWVKTPTNFGITDFAADAQLPIQGQELNLSLQIYNGEAFPLTLDALTVTAGEQVIYDEEMPEPLAPGESRRVTFPYTCPDAGVVSFRAEFSGAIRGMTVSCNEELSLSFRPTVLKARILVDGLHSDVSDGELESLKAVALAADQSALIFRDELARESKILILPPLSRDLSPEYVESISRFLKSGGDLILCGTAGDNTRANALLSGLGATMKFHNDTARDPVNNDGKADRMYPNVFNSRAGFWEDLPDNAVYSHLSGCSLNPASGTWLVQGRDTMEAEGKTLLAVESVGGGRIFASGSFFLGDDAMPLPENSWDLPRVNQLLLENLLEIRRTPLTRTPIQTVRKAEAGDVFRVKGYVTVGTSRPENRFPGRIWLQDDTGGIAVTDFDQLGIHMGARMDLTGQLYMENGNPTLKLISFRVLPVEWYRHDPEVMENAEATDYKDLGGQLVKVEGLAENITYTKDKKGVLRFTLRDAHGDPATFVVEPGILSRESGKNTLAEQVMAGKKVRAMGVLHLEKGGSPVILVRNCDEVTCIPPVPDLSNPQTGDSLGWLLYFF